MTDDDEDALREEIRKVAAELKAYYDELEGESPRAAAILAVASLDDELERLIRYKFPPDLDDKLWKKIAGPGFTPLGTLKAKADMAQAFGFYGQKTRKLIGCIATVRNKFGHSREVRSFDHPLIMRECKNLDRNHVFPEGTVTDNSPPTHVRWVYIQTVRILEERLAAIREYVPELDGTAPEPLP